MEGSAQENGIFGVIGQGKKNLWLIEGKKNLWLIVGAHFLYEMLERGIV